MYDARSFFFNPCEDFSKIVPFFEVYFCVCCHDGSDTKRSITQGWYCIFDSFGIALN